MNELYPSKVQQAVNALLTNPGSSTPTLRSKIQAYAANLRLDQGNSHDIPDDLVAYIDKVVLHAYKVTDKDVQQLKEAGYSEDAIFEITLCASVGASLSQFGRGLSALK